MGIGWIILVGYGSSGWAEQNNQDGKVVMNEVVVTATKTEEKRKDIPNSLVVKDQTDIEASPAKNLGQLLANEPGIDWRSYGDYGGAAQSFLIRGMQAKDSLVLVNGVQLNSPSLGEADVSGILLNNIEQVEVVKGSGSLLYGSGAMGGTVNIITKEPSRDQMDLSLEGGYGSQQTYRVSAENGMFITDDFGYYLTADRLETDGHRDNGDLEQNNASLKLVLDKGKPFRINLYGQIVDKDYGTPGIRPPDGTSDFILPATGEKLYSRESASLKDNTESQDIHSILEVASQPTSWLKYRIAGKYIRTDSIHETWYNANDAPPPFGTGLLAGEALRSQVVNDVLGAEANIELQPWSHVKLLIGTDFHDFEWESKTRLLNRDGSSKGAETSTDADLYNVGTYAEAQYRVNPYVKLQYGLRQEYDSNFGAEYLPRYGLVLNPSPSTAIKLNRGKHFRAPTLNDLYWPEDAFVRGNPSLKPQTGWHADLTLEQEVVGDRLFFTASIFEWDIEDQIRWAQNPAFPGAFGDKWTPSNVSRSWANGFEASVTYRVIPQVTLAVDYTRIEAREEVSAGKRDAQYVPETQYKFSAIYRNMVGTLASVTVRHTDDRINYRSDASILPDDKLKAYTTVDLKLEQRFKTHWLVSLYAHNLCDEAYDTYVSSFVDSSGAFLYGAYPGAGQSLFASLAYEF